MCTVPARNAFAVRTMLPMLRSCCQFSIATSNPCRRGVEVGDDGVHRPVAVARRRRCGRRRARAGRGRSAGRRARRRGRRARGRRRPRALVTSRSVSARAERTAIASRPSRELLMSAHDGMGCGGVGRRRARRRDRARRQPRRHGDAARRLGAPHLPRPAVQHRAHAAAAVDLDPAERRRRAHRLQGPQLRHVKGALSRYDDTFADYWAFLEPRLAEAWRLLDERGTLYLHLDYREAHYAKVALDALFGRESFLNELIWAYDYGAKATKRWPAKHDTILVYVKDPARYHFDSAAVDREPYMAPGLVTPEKAARGKLPTDVWWHTIVSTNGAERTGYPTQKPHGILRRIVQASTEPGDLVLDFFAGSGTTGAAAARARAARPAGRREPGCRGRHAKAPLDGGGLQRLNSPRHIRCPRSRGVVLMSTVVVARSADHIHSGAHRPLAHSHPVASLLESHSLHLHTATRLLHRRARRRPAMVDLDGHHPQPARPRAVAGLGHHLRRSDRHRTRRRQDRQGGRPLPDRASRAGPDVRRPARAAQHPGRQALPHDRAPRLQPLVRVPGGPPHPPQPRRPRAREGQRVRPRRWPPTTGRSPSSRRSA